jgi:phenylacetaldehyde dehydrogenase
MIWVNCYQLADPGSPWGGYKQSGWGRELGPQAIDLYTEVKDVWLDLS